MRDPSRIDRLLEQLAVAWHAFPDMRLGQLLINATRVVNTDRLWTLEDDELARLLQAFTKLMTEPSGLRYVKRRWHEVRGDHTDSWGYSWWYFEIDLTGKVIRQVEEYENGTTLGYDSRTPADEFGQLSVEPLDQALVGFDFTTAADFDDRWERRTNR